MVFAVTLTLVLSGCGNDGYSLEGKNIVSFDLGGGKITTKNSSFDTINFAYDPGTYILDPIEDLDYTLNRPDYNFTGWYVDAECKQKWDFKTPFTEEKLTLYAGWEKAIKYTYTVYYVDNGAAVALGSYTVTPGQTYKDYNNYKSSRKNYTAMGIYSDINLTTPWNDAFTHPGGAVDTDVPVYVDYIPGTWNIVSTFDALKSAIKAEKNIYLTADINCGAEELVSLTTAKKYDGIFEGNGHTVSNFKIKCYVDGQQAKAAIFPSLVATSEIRNVNFTEVLYDFTGIADTVNTESVKASALAVTSTGAKITDVTISGKIVTNYSGSLPKLNEAVYDKDDETVISGTFSANITIEVQN